MQNLSSEVPLFVCNLSYPGMPTFLHVFEPRYRLMMRRVVESESRTFGMVLHNRFQEVQGDLGRIPFFRTGTLLRIQSLQLLPDGRSLVESIGVSRFSVVDWSTKDGYLVGKLERHDDVGLAEEERIESAEVATQLSRERAGDVFAQLDVMATAELFDLCTDFVTRMRQASAPWLRTNILQAFGQPPINDPVLFPYWFASVLPLGDPQKYSLLLTRSVRERLKMTAGWIKELESQRWWAG